jgi:hypothetical protein
MANVSAHASSVIVGGSACVVVTVSDVVVAVTGSVVVGVGMVGDGVVVGGKSGAALVVSPEMVVDSAVSDSVSPAQPPATIALTAMATRRDTAARRGCECLPRPFM